MVKKTKKELKNLRKKIRFKDIRQENNTLLFIKHCIMSRHYISKKQKIKYKNQLISEIRAKKLCLIMKTFAQDLDNFELIYAYELDTTGLKIVATFMKMSNILIQLVIFLMNKTLPGSSLQLIFLTLLKNWILTTNHEIPVVLKNIKSCLIELREIYSTI